jgi:hypothetical protein
LCALAFSLAASAQTPPPTGTPAKAATTELVTCGDKPPLISRTVRTDTLVSPDGKHRAYGEVEATALFPQRQPGYSGPLCVNSSKLYVANDSQDSKIVFLQEPTDMENGNGLRLVDWSSDSRRLLIELVDWHYEQPGVNRTILLYDTRYQTFQQPDLAHALAKAYAHDCSFDFHVAGFNTAGKIILEANPLSPEEEEVEGVPSCARKTTWFEMDRSTETLVSLTEAPKVQRYAKIEPAPK